MSDINEELKSIDESMAEEIPPTPAAPEAPEPNFSESDCKGSGYTYTASPSDDSDEEVGKILAIVSIVTGILSVVCCCSLYIGLTMAIASIVCGIISLRKSSLYKTIAIVGIVCGGCGAVFAGICILFKLVFGIADLLANFFGAIF